MIKNKHNFIFGGSFDDFEKTPYYFSYHARRDHVPHEIWNRCMGYIKSHDQYICKDCGTIKLKFFVMIGAKKKFIGCAYLTLDTTSEISKYRTRYDSSTNPPNCSDVIIKDILT